MQPVLYEKTIEKFGADEANGITYNRQRPLHGSISDILQTIAKFHTYTSTSY